MASHTTQINEKECTVDWEMSLPDIEAGIFSCQIDILRVVDSDGNEVFDYDEDAIKNEIQLEMDAARDEAWEREADEERIRELENE